MMITTTTAYHYALDAVKLLDDCMEKLQLTIDRDIYCQHFALYDLKQALINTDRILHDHLLHVLEEEIQDLPNGYDNINEYKVASLSETVSSLITIVQEKKRLQDITKRTSCRNPQESLSQSNNENQQQQQLFLPPRSATDTLLFRLIVALQLCVVRIDDAHLVITGKRINQSSHTHPLLTSSLLIATGCVITVGATIISFGKKPTKKMNIWIQPIISSLFQSPSLLDRNTRSTTTTTVTNLSYPYFAIKTGIAAIGARWLSNWWNTIWMTDKISRSTIAIEEWQQQWNMVLVTTPTTTSSSVDATKAEPTTATPTSSNHDHDVPATELLDAKSRRLIEYAMKESPKSSFWQSQGEMRFLMLKRAMDVFYASVGTAIKSVDEPTRSTWQVPLVTAAAASFYSLTGASRQALDVVNSSSRDLIQHAWGMVSLPAIKNLMLQASRLIKGAAVADRFEIAGVPCFVLSRAPAPELAAALKRHHHAGRMSRPCSTFLSKLSTIHESEATSPSKACASTRRKFAGTGGRYRQRDVILHLTGGGFFAHTIASDLPYLLDWSAATGAVVICPEYALLPEHTFPVALDQVSDVYSALKDGDATSQLGFETNRIIVTGESAGGNLAASLCTKLGMEFLCQVNDETNEVREPENHSTHDNLDGQCDQNQVPNRMPDAMMLSCAALNLSLELSHSRVVGVEDPVLPSGLISAISDAYLPPTLGLSKKDPLASPFFAPNNVIELFPPTLLFAGSKDPLLDDSVVFNERLRSLGVNSELRAAHNVPHAYWGLGTAGFPEARQVQRECEEWLSHQFGLQP